MDELKLIHDTSELANPKSRHIYHGYPDLSEGLTLSDTKYRFLCPNIIPSTQYLISYKVTPLFIIKLVSLLGAGKGGNSGLW
jgi:hypothetical protein